MSDAAPRIDRRLLAALAQLDDPRRPIAETNRRVGRLACRLGLVRPSYEQVRVLVHAQRRTDFGPTFVDVALDVAFRVRPPEALLDHLAGTAPDLEHRAPNDVS